MNHALYDYVNAWNYHSLSSSHSETPLQIYTKGMVASCYHNIPAIDYFDPVHENSYRVNDVDDIE